MLKADSPPFGFFTTSLPTFRTHVCSYSLMNLRVGHVSSPANRTFSLKQTKKIFLLAIITLLVVALPSWAELGGNIASVKTDQEKMSGSLKVTAASAFEIHEIQSAQGTKVREYVSPAGTVFGVAWEGPSKPDLRQLLGSYFNQYINAAQSAKTRRGPVTIEVPGLVVQTGGHMRSFVGRAYLPQMIPQGASADAIK